MQFTDQLNRTVRLDEHPRKIISLVPSQTELLSYLGLDEYIAGITKFCIHPSHIFGSRPRVGGTKTLDFEKIRALNPGLIICNKEENDQVQVERLINHFPVWVSDVKNLDDACDMIRGVGEITGKKNEAGILISNILKEFESIHLLQHRKRTAAYLIWNNPYMTINRNTFIHDMMARAGFENVFAGEHERYPIVTVETLKKIQPQTILLSSEPFPFRQSHKVELQNKLEESEIILADGELFSWYGSRLLISPAYFKTLSA